MNTTEIGDEFEAQSYSIIEDALNAGKLGIYSAQCKIYRKKGYYSRDRQKEIIFDLTIEVWPPGASNFILLYIIECKNYSGTVPVNDVEEFYAKILQVSGVNAKGVLITSTSFQEGAYFYAKSKGMMLISTQVDTDYQILLHRVERSTPSLSNEFETWDEVLGGFFERLYESRTKVLGLRQLSADEIETKAETILDEMDETILAGAKALPIESLIQFLYQKYNIAVDLSSDLGRDENRNRILGYFDKDLSLIRLDPTVVNSERFLFTLSHEIGHAVLHQDLKINQRAYARFKDSSFNFILGKHELKNDRQWIEWQANHFAACLTLPKAPLWSRVVSYQLQNGIRNPGTIYHDQQPINRKDFYDITMFLTQFFGVSMTSLSYRLTGLGILKEPASSGSQYAFDPRRALRES